MKSSNPDATTKTAAPGPNLGDLPPLAPQPANLVPPQIPDFELLKRIGEGSYGEVWLARNLTGTLRAVKVVHRKAFESDRPFEREFEGIKRFEPLSQTHESQLKIFHVGRQNGYFYYVMELADASSADGEVRKAESIPSHGVGGQSGEGSDSKHPTVDPLDYVPRTLRGELQRVGRLPMDQTLDISLRLAEALGHLHRHGLVHRDVKPSNIIFVNGQPKLADIGLVADSEGTLTFVGTEGYLPPEGPGKPAADLFSLGKVLYEVSTGHDRNQFPELPTHWNSTTERDAFAEFNEVIVRACAAQTAQRYATAEQLHADLLLLRAGKSISRLRVLERRLARLAQLSAAALVLSAVVTAAYFYQHHQTRTSQRLGVQLQVNNGLRLLDEGDLQGSLLWFTEALQNGQGCLSADEQSQHRLRISAVMRQCPRLARLIVPDIAGQPPLLQLDPQASPQGVASTAGEGRMADYGGSAAFSPDGRTILISGYGRTVLLCDAATGEIIRRLEHSTNLKGGVFSGDGRRVVTWLERDESGVAGDVQVWDANNGQRIGAPLIHPFNHSITISHEGRRVLTVGGGEAQVWDADTSRKLGPPLVHDTFVRGGELSSDGLWVLTWSRIARGNTNELAQIWDASNGRKSGPPMSPSNGQVHATFDRDCSRVVTQSSGRIDIWDRATARHQLTIPRAYHGGRQLTPDGRRIILTGTFNGIIQMHDMATGAQIGPVIRQEKACFSPALSSDGKRIAASCGMHIHVWDLMTGRPAATPIPINDNTQLQFNRDGQRLLAAGGEKDPVVRIWDLSGAEPAVVPMIHQGWVFRASFSPDGRRVATASQDETARVWDVASAKPVGAPLHTNHIADYSLFVHYPQGRLIHPLGGHWVRSVPSGLGSFEVFHPVLGDRILGLGRMLHSTNRAVFFAEFAPDSKRVITTGYDGTARVWDAGSSRELIPPLKHAGAIYHAAFSRDGRRVATTSADWTAQVWNAGTGQRVGPPLQHQGAVLHADFSPDGNAIVTASYDMTAQLWDAETGQKIGPPLQHPNPDFGPVYTAVFSPDGRQVLTASYDGTAQLWDGRTGRKTTPPLRHRFQVLHAEFSRDGKQIVTASPDATAQVWNVQTGARVGSPLVHGVVVNHATFSPDGKLIATASFDGTARVWDVATSQPLTPPLRHADRVWHAEFSPDGRQVLTASSDATARLWSLQSIDWPASDLRLFARILASRQLDPTGRLSPLEPEALKENWAKLQTKPLAR